MIYTLEHHKHNFAVWAASTAASASPLCRFEVRLGKLILERSGFTPDFNSKSIPSAREFDSIHASWRNLVIKVAKKNGKTFTHGVAAKLLNCYLKVRFVCGGDYNSEIVDYIHPPIDALLLSELARNKFGSNAGIDWQSFQKLRWSKFTSKQYELVISKIKSVMKEQPLWTLEKYWPIHA